MSRAFWLVWNPEGGNPQHKHDDVGSAVSEAERLARKYPGQKFIVLESVCSREVNNMDRVVFVVEPDQDIPF